MTKLKVEVDLGEITDEWGTSVEGEIKAALGDEVKKLVRQWFKEQETSFRKQLDGFGLRVTDKKIVERAVAEFLYSTLPSKA